jgi:biopolymer transport protein ExbB
MIVLGATLIERFAAAFEAVGAAWVLWLLVCLSVISVAIMLERLIFFSTHSLGDIKAIARMLEHGDLEGAAKMVGNRRGLEAEVVREGVLNAPQGADAVEEVVQRVIQMERLGYERFLAFLNTLGNNAPFIGLFGTVLGIIAAFAQLASSAKSGTVTTSSSGVMAGISEALVATAVGLLVALPAVAMNNFFVRWLKTVTARGESLGHALAAHLKSIPAEGEDATRGGPVSLPRSASGT